MVHAYMYYNYYVPGADQRKNTDVICQRYKKDIFGVDYSTTLYSRERELEQYGAHDGAKHKHLYAVRFNAAKTSAHTPSIF